ncbi:siderophore ABC transporter substrate-binding protein [uncultured Micrococcus sp.]|uniref:siderophore ABC transporter substrate-binding protein n=1 Tax=uncultured Micrococcus sp. TaxID=114051 RepID=UPI0025972073|nr:ABC transporter substrate-binding protein [uncultured Micrococcus sp.]
MALRSRATRAASLSVASLLLLTACGTGASSDGGDSPASGSGSADGGVAVGAEVTDMSGATVQIPEEVDSVIATDNRSFRTLDEWGVELSAAPKQIMYEGEGEVSYVKDEKVTDIGNHKEPDMEAFVTAEPDVVINGQRFAERKGEIDELTGDAAIVDTDFKPEDKRVDKGLKELTTLLGEATGHEDEAKQLNTELDDSIARAKEAYNGEDTVMGLMVTGGNTTYVAPGNGRSIGPLFDILDLKPAIDQQGSNDHQGDDISVEAIAKANPDWLIVMDRDAAIGEDAASADEVIEKSEALQDVTAVKKGQIVYLPDDFYVAEDIQNHTKLFNDLADAFEGAQ